jgi:tetratricopeptide (TPR) repeat protein
MKKTLLTVSIVALLGLNNLSAQSVDNAKKMYYYERFITAKTELEKIVAANPNNEEANYWLILSNLRLAKIADARNIATKALASTNNSPLIQVAAGHVDLQDGKKQDAKLKFEAAVTASNKKNLVNTLTAIGRANASVKAELSDADYALEKVNQALAKDPKNGDLKIIMGDLYRKKIDGGNAVKSYMEATYLPGTNIALANYRIGSVYLTQDNCEAIKQYYQAAIAADGNFMPALRDIFDVYCDSESGCYNMAEGRTYLDRYVASVDQGLDADKIKMRFYYYNKEYAKAIQEVDNAFAKYGDVDITLHKFKGNIYRLMNDSINALNAYETYLAKETNTELLTASFYKQMGEVASKVVGKETTALSYYSKAVELEKEPLPASKIMLSIIAFYNKQKDYKNAALWYNKFLEVKPKPTNVDLFNANVANYRAENFSQGEAIAKKYTEQYPDDWRGPFWTARHQAQQDSTGTLGLAVPAYEQFALIAEKDAVRNKSNLVEAYRYLISQYVSNKNNKAIAQGYLEKLKSLDPTNVDLPTLESMVTGRPVPKPATPAPSNAPAPIKTPTKTTTAPKTGSKAAVPTPTKASAAAKPATTVKPPTAKTPTATKPTSAVKPTPKKA